MPDKKEAQELLLRQKLLPLYYHPDYDVSLSILQALYEAGIRVVEYTNRGSAALQNFRRLKKETAAQFPDLLLGIGTVKNATTAQQYMDAGADFIIAPSVNEEVGKTVHDNGLLWVPGCMTPTEIATAEDAGASLVKIFPGNLLGPSYITAIRDLFPDLGFIVTGGVEAEAQNLRAWFDAGVKGVGMGSKLISKAALEAGDYNGIRAQTKMALQLVQQYSTGV